MDATTFSRSARAHLVKQEEILRVLLDCLAREKAALVRLDAAQAADIAAEKEEIVRLEQALAAERRELVGEAAALVRRESGGAAVDLSLGEIVERLRPPGGGELMALRGRVRKLAADAQKANAVNRQLCVHALSCMRGYASLSGRPQNDTYGARGRLVSHNAAGSAYARRY